MQSFKALHAAILVSLSLAGQTIAASEEGSSATGTAISSSGSKTAPPQDAETEASRKAFEGFLSMLAKHDVRGAVERYASETYIQHMSGIAPGREGAIAHIEQELARGGKASLLGMVAHGNMVGVHIRHEYADGSPSREVIEIWRLENGKFAEHWAVAQEGNSNQKR